MEVRLLLPQPISQGQPKGSSIAYVAGYTEAGFAYGITWEEWDRLDQSDLLDPQGDSNTNFNDEPPELPF